jgi:glycosyltransferase involved in cell wall biosynthesis
LKILHVIDSINLTQGGPSVSVPALAAAQAKQGHRVTIACRDYAYLGPMAEAVGVEVRSVPSSRWTKGQGGWGCSFRRLVEKEAAKADLVHNHGVWLAANYYARRAAVKAGKPLVISPRGMLEDWSLRRAVVRKFVAWQLFERKNLESAALFHATADSEAEAIKTALRIKMKIKIKEPRIVVAPNGVDIPERIPNREALEARFPKMMGKKWILFMSRVHPKKGLLELAKAWMQIRESNPGWELVIAGPEQDKGYAEKVRAELKGEGVWTGELRGEEKWAALGQAEFLVLPSHSENFGIVVAESLAAGRPVVTTNKTPWGAARSEIKMKIKMKGPSFAPNLSSSGGASEGGCAGGTMNLEERKCGVICEVTDLKRGLERMLEFSDKEREEMGARGRQWMKKEFSWEAGAERLIAGYKEIGVGTLD